jgi:hypothetical protein
MFRFDQDPDAMETIASNGDEGGYFASSTNWFQDVISASHYFGPLLGCVSPGFWCVPTGRPPAAILFSLGKGIAGYRHSPMEPMQLLPGAGRDEPVPDEELSPTSCRVAIIWWTNRLNQMFGYFCDPTVFSNKHGVYDPYEHQHWLLTFGQVFGLTTALQDVLRGDRQWRELDAGEVGFTARLVRDPEFSTKLREGIEAMPRGARYNDIPRKDLVEIGQRSGLDEERLAQRLGIGHDQLAMESWLLWRRSFSDKRDELAGADANAQKRGRISRKLQIELQAELEKARADGDD